MGTTPHRIALVGLGPRGTYALERLLDRCRELAPEVSLEITGFEPHPAPGAGPIYDPAQPSYLRMNFAAEMIDMWWPGRGLPAAEHRMPFESWRSARAERSSGAERYPPRAEVGEYLSEGLNALLAATPAHVNVGIVARRVLAIEPENGAWRLSVEGPEGKSDGFDEVLLCTGHLAAEAETETERDQRLGQIGAVFPVERLSETAVPPSSVVAVRGMALTFLDAALALTEGRGGGFEPVDAHPYRRAYVASGREPAVLLPYSRSGRPMLVKPDPDLASSIAGVGPAAEQGLDRLRSAPAPLELAGGLRRILMETAERMICAAGAASERDSVAAELEARLSPSRELAGTARSGSSIHGQLELSLEIGVGLAPPNALWALGEAWRSLYPAIVDRVGGEGLAESDWPSFLHLAAEMERIAFGPPIENGAKLLTLIEQRLIDTCHAAGARVRPAGGRFELASPGADGRPVDVLVDAVSPAPGALHLQDGLIGALRATGLVRIPEGRRGIEIDADGCCVGAGGRPVPGLAALGRIAEDWVVGNDTLSRRLHGHSDAWARAVIDRAGRTAPRNPSAHASAAHAGAQR